MVLTSARGFNDAILRDSTSADRAQREREREIESLLTFFRRSRAPFLSVSLINCERAFFCLARSPTFWLTPTPESSANNAFNQGKCEKCRIMDIAEETLPRIRHFLSIGLLASGVLLIKLSSSFPRPHYMYQKLIQTIALILTRRVRNIWVTDFYQIERLCFRVKKY